MTRPGLPSPVRGFTAYADGLSWTPNPGNLFDPSLVTACDGRWSSFPEDRERAEIALAEIKRREEMER